MEELLPLVTELGLPTVIVFLLLFSGRAVWRFVVSEVWPWYQQSQEAQKKSLMMWREKMSDDLAITSLRVTDLAHIVTSVRETVERLEDRCFDNVRNTPDG